MSGKRSLDSDHDRVGGKLGKVCTTISGKTAEEMTKKAATAFALGTDLVELRIDLMEKPSAEQVARLRRFFRKAIVTLRRKEEGGGFNGGEKERLGLISEVSKTRPLYLDIELSTVRENPAWYIDLPRTSRKIISWHDLAGTPALSVIKRVRADEGSLGEVAKIVTTAKKPSDNWRVLKLYEEKPTELIAFCMGPVGIPSRLASLQHGSPVTYASLPNEPVAPGQLSVTTVVALKRLWERRGW